MRRPHARLRPGYTLLEVLIASAIAVLLMSALYFAFDLTLQTSDSGRALVAESNLNRAVVNRMALDLSSPLGVLPPLSGGAIDGSGDATPVETVPAATDGTTTTTTTTTPETAAPASLIAFQAGVIGTGESLILFASRVPRYLSDREIAADAAALPSDGHRISYYLHSSGKGLCRQDKEWLTEDKVGNSTEIDRTNEDAEIIAPEVVAMQFQYADGAAYVSEWDGSQSSTDGSSTTGPPRAIKASITFEFKDRDGNAVQKTIVHVFPIRTGVGLIPPPETTTTETP